MCECVTATVGLHEINYAQVTTPLNLSNIGVRQMELGDLSRFARITVLNLSQNRLTTLAGFGLEAMASLVQLDVHDNLLQYALFHACNCVVCL
jgi:hypothetical protein